MAEMDYDKLQALHSEVWAFRDSMKEVWPTVDQLCALRYAFSEAGEAMDAWIRLNYPEHKRNHVKDADVLGELADCALMLITALGPELPKQEFDFKDRNDGIPIIDAVCLMVSLAYSWQDNGAIADAITAIDVYPGMDLEAELRRRMARLKAKHAPDMQNAQAEHQSVL